MLYTGKLVGFNKYIVPNNNIIINIWWQIKKLDEQSVVTSLHSDPSLRTNDRNLTVQHVIQIYDPQKNKKLC